MSNAAVVDNTGAVVNMIVADASVDLPPPGYTLVDIPPETVVDIGYTYDFTNGFQPSVPVVVATGPDLIPVN